MMISSPKKHSEASALQDRLHATGVTDVHLLSYLLDREKGIGHVVALQRLSFRAHLRSSDRAVVAEILLRLAPKTPSE